MWITIIIFIISAIGFTSIISQEIKSDDELNVIGNLLIAIGSNLALGAAQRSSCNNIDENNTTDNINNQDITLVDDNISTLRSQENNKRKIKKVKIRKRLKTE